MKAIILNSGIGRRMGKLTENNPKCLVELKDGLTILGHELQILAKNGIKDFIITTGPFEEKIKDYVAKNFPGINVIYVNNPKYNSTNAIYSLFLAKELIDDDIILMHGDMVFDDMAFKALIGTSHKNAAIIDKNADPPEKDFKALVSDGIIRKIAVDINGDNCFFSLPVYKFSKDGFNILLEEITKFVERNEVNVYAENAFNSISDKISLKPVHVDYFCMEIDNLDDLETAKRKFFS